MRALSEIWWILALLAVGSYLIGSLNFSIIISKKKGNDIRGMGSGNPGMMNMSRNFGLKTGALILALDMFKGALPTFIGMIVFWNVRFTGTDFYISDMAKYLCGFFAVLGHVFPFYLKFKGGKGISTTIGVSLVAYPLVGFISGVIGLIFILITSVGSMGSLICITPPAIAAEIHLFLKYVYDAGSGLFIAGKEEILLPLILTSVFVVGICALSWFAHRKNIKALVCGEEHLTTWSAMLKKAVRKRRAARAGDDAENIAK